MKQLPEPRIIVLEPNALVRYSQPRIRRRRKLLSRPLLSSVLACAIAISACAVTYKPAEITAQYTTPSSVSTVFLPTATPTIPENHSSVETTPTEIATLAAPVESKALPTAQPQPSAAEMHASMLRATLNALFGEHVALLSSATDATLRGRNVEVAAATQALDVNSVAIAEMIGLVYGKEAGVNFLPLWRKQVDSLLDYTNPSGRDNEKGRQQALDQLATSGEEINAFLAAANLNLPGTTIAELLRQYVTTLTAVIDAQAAKTAQASGNQMNAYPALRTAFAHMDIQAETVAVAIADQFPARFPGRADTPAASLHSTLVQLFAEHALLLIKTVDAAIHARTIEYEAAFAALDANSIALSSAVRSLYGYDAGSTFQRLWRTHIGLFIDYTLALIDRNQATKAQTLDKLAQSTQEIAAFLHAANPELSTDFVAGLLSEHVQSTRSAIDASAANELKTYYAALHAAYSQMSMLANSLSATLLDDFPSKFGDYEASRTNQVTADE
ncbi:MAG: hypothetical protein U0175_13930 [Caldilineaceae bacterium]